MNYPKDLIINGNKDMHTWGKIKRLRRTMATRSPQGEQPDFHAEKSVVTKLIQI